MTTDAEVFEETETPDEDIGEDIVVWLTTTNGTLNEYLAAKGWSPWAIRKGLARYWYNEFSVCRFFSFVEFVSKCGLNINEREAEGIINWDFAQGQRHFPVRG